MSSILFLEDKRYVNLDNGDIYMGGTKQDHLPHKHIQLLKLLVSQNNVYHSSEEIYNRLEIDRINPTISEIRTAICDCKIGKGRSVSGRGFKDTWKYINNETNLGYKFNSKYRIVELLETAPNNIEPLTSKDNFVEEPKLIDKIFGAFEEGNKIVFLSGISGSGKSELARSFCPKYKDTFYSVLHFTLTPDGNGSFEDLLAENDKFFGDSGLDRTQKIKARKDVIKKLGKESLIIIDNLNNDKNLAFLNDIHDIFGTRPTGAAKILITTTLSGNTFADYLHYDCKVIEIEKERDKKQLAYDILARKAGISESENEDIKAIVKAIGYHPLCSAIIGAQVKEYNLDLAYLRDVFDRDLKKALSSGESVLFRKDDINADFKPYEILKYIFKNVSKNLNKMERQVLGAYLLLPESQHKLEALSELVGDIKGKCSRAKGAIRILYRKCLIEIDKDGTVILHPLLEQLFQDGEFLESGTTVAELSDGFRIHLLNNIFASENSNINEQLDGLFFYRKYTIFKNKQSEFIINSSFYDKLLDFQPKCATNNVGWILSNKRKKEDFSQKDILILKEGINLNQENLGLKCRIDEETLYQLFDCENNMALYFVVKYEKGFGIILFDYNNQKEYCLVNCSEQRDIKNRYYNDGDKLIQKSTPIEATFIGSFCDHLKGALIIPDYIGGTHVKSICRQTLDPFDIENKELTMLFVPETVETIEAKSFEKFTNLQCVVFGNGRIHIKRRAFYECNNLKYVLFSQCPCRIGQKSFESTNIEEVVVLKGTIVDIMYDMQFLSSLDDMLVNGKYYQAKDDNMVENELVEDIFKELIDIINMPIYETNDELFDEFFDEAFDSVLSKRFNFSEEQLEIKREKYKLLYDEGKLEESFSTDILEAMKEISNKRYFIQKGNQRTDNVFEYDINEIYQRWFFMSKVYDNTNTQPLDWKEFYTRWMKTIKINGGIFGSLYIDETFVIGETLVIDKLTDMVLNDRLFIRTDTPMELQRSLLDAFGMIERIITPFHPNNRQIVIAETSYVQALHDSLKKNEILCLCKKFAEYYNNMSKHILSKQYLDFANNLKLKRPDLFQDFEEDENEYRE